MKPEATSWYGDYRVQAAALGALTVVLIVTFW
jgi:hypothetical protein